MPAFVFQALIAFAPALRAEPAPIAQPANAMAQSQPPAATRPHETYAAETPWFSIIGDDANANDRVATLAIRIGRELGRNGFTPQDLATDRVTVYVNSGDGGVAFNTADARTSLRIPSGVLNDERTVAEALAKAVLTRIAQASGKTPAPADHAIEALAWEARLSGPTGMTAGRVPPEQHPGTQSALTTILWEESMSGPSGMTQFMIRSAGKFGPLDLDALGAPATPADYESHAISAFWLHRAIRENRFGAPRIALAQAAVGTPLRATLARIIPDMAAGGQRAAAWWPAAFYRQSTDQVSPVETPEESQTRFRDVSRFVISENDKDLALDGAGMIARRNRPELIDAVKMRLLEIKTQLPRTNPVWQNAILSRGLFLEALATAEPAELQRLDTSALVEADAARRTNEEIARSLNAPQ